jgi:hypothetical protein
MMEGVVVITNCDRKERGAVLQSNNKRCVWKEILVVVSALAYR